MSWELLRGRRLHVACLSIGLALVAEARGEELDFRVVPETRIAPVAKARTNSATSALPSRLPDFRVLGSDANDEAHGVALDFAVMGGADSSAKGPTVYVYSESEERCAPCRRLKADFEAGLVPMQFEWRQPPAWVQAYPTLHWQDAAGGWRQWSGWPGATRFRQIHRNTNVDAQKKK